MSCRATGVLSFVTVAWHLVLSSVGFTVLCPLAGVGAITHHRHRACSCCSVVCACVCVCFLRFDFGIGRCIYRPSAMSRRPQVLAPVSNSDALHTTLCKHFLEGSVPRLRKTPTLNIDTGVRACNTEVNYRLVFYCRGRWCLTKGLQPCGCKRIPSIRNSRPVLSSVFRGLVLGNVIE
jgi:hypothetical protein